MLGNRLEIMTEQMVREKEETKVLVTDISHQLKTPVAALKTCFEILKDPMLKEEDRREFFERCTQQLKGLETLLAALINISRMETGMIEIRKENACIFETLVEAVNRVYVKADEKKIDLEVEAGEEEQRRCLPHDRKWLCEALINLLENAIKYSPEESRVTNRFFIQVMLLRIEIQDQGIGIPKQEYNQIFKRFYRGQSRQVKEQEGSGVGLYLTTQILQRHGGTIMVSSPPDGGSIFILQLPLQD